nr:hypothetical protein [Tanacetum cinerariifolium]
MKDPCGPFLAAHIVKRDDEIKVFWKINLELQSGPHKLIEKLCQEKVSQEEALEQFKSMVERDDEIKVLGKISVDLESGTYKLREKLSQEEDSEKEATEEFNSTLDNVFEKLSQEKDSPDEFYGFMYDIDNDASISEKSYEALSNQEVANECLDDEHVKEEDQSRGLESPKKRWSRMKSQRKADKDPLIDIASLKLFEFPTATSAYRRGKLAIDFIVIDNGVFGLKMMLGKNT